MAGTSPKTHIPSNAEFHLILSAWEGQFVEFKEAISDGLDREIVAFANSEGGKIYIGVSDSKKVTGVNVTNRTVSQIYDFARNCEPAITVNVGILNYHKKKVLVIEVPGGEQKPYSCGRGYFFRSGANSQKMSRDELLRFVRAHGDVRFDEVACKNFAYPKDFSATSFKKFLAESKISGRGVTREDLLCNLGFGEHKKKSLTLNNAAVLFFAKNPKRFHIQSRISCILFQGSDKSTILDRKDFEGTLVESVQGALAFLGQHIPLQYKIEKLKREEIPLIPEAAMREALLNAVIHRDYFERGGSVMVELYRDRLEIINPGGLMAGLRIEDLGRFSLPRNPIIADMFFRLGFVEKAGTGIGRIRNSMTKAGLKPPVFETGFFFVVKFQLPVQKTETQKPLSPSSGTKSGLSRDQVVVLEFCEIPRRLLEIMKPLKRTNRTKFRDGTLKPLISDGLLSMTVKGKPQSRLQKYVTTKKGLKILVKRNRTTT